MRTSGRTTYRVMRRVSFVGMLLGLILASLSPAANAATSTKVAYVTDFGAGVNDPVFPPSGGSSIFNNAVGGVPLPNGGTYNGATFTNVPITTIDSSPGTALAGFETIFCRRLSGSIFMAARPVTAAEMPSVWPFGTWLLHRTKALRYAVLGRPAIALVRAIKVLIGRPSRR